MPISIRVNRLDWVIAGGRVLLAAFGLLAIWLDPSQPARFQDFTYSLLWAYLAYALLLLVFNSVRSLPSEGMALFTHLIDLCLFALLMCLTEGATSPFFVLFTFALLVATLRWSWQGVLWTAAASLLVLSLLGWWLGHILADPEFELNRFIIRAVYLAVASLLLAFLAGHQDRTRSLLARLSSEPPPLSGDSDWPIDSALAFAGMTLGSGRILLAWTEKEEPWQHLGLYREGEIKHRSEAPDRFEPLVAPDLGDASFASLDTGDDNAVVIHRGGGHFQRWRGLPLHPDLRREFDIRAVMSVPIEQEQIEARLFLLNPGAYSADDLPLLELVASRIRSQFDQHALLRRLRFAAADEERLRLARDIHDGVLQFLAGAGLNLHSAAALVETDPAGARQRITELQQGLVVEQVQLRTLVNSLRVRNPANPAATSPLGQALQPLLSHLREHWDIDIQCSINPADASLDPDRLQDVARLLSEAIANARRHGQATAIDTGVALDGDRIDLLISDNGGGFNTAGHFDHDQLQALGIGPRSLSERVATLGGRMSLQTSATGTRIDIRLPRRVASQPRPAKPPTGSC